MGLLPSPEVRGKEIVNVSMIYINPPQRYAAQRGEGKDNCLSLVCRRVPADRSKKPDFPVQSVPSLPLKHLFLPDSCEPRKRRFKGQSVHTAGITQRRKEGKSIIVCPRYAGESRQIEVKSRISLSCRG